MCHHHLDHIHVETPLHTPVMLDAHWLTYLVGLWLMILEDLWLIGLDSLLQRWTVPALDQKDVTRTLTGLKILPVATAQGQVEKHVPYYTVWNTKRKNLLCGLF